jgi:hypothetical protein
MPKYLQGLLAGWGAFYHRNPNNWGKTGEIEKGSPVSSRRPGYVSRAAAGNTLRLAGRGALCRRESLEIGTISRQISAVGGKSRGLIDSQLLLFDRPFAATSGRDQISERLLRAALDMQDFREERPLRV